MITRLIAFTLFLLISSKIKGEVISVKSDLGIPNATLLFIENGNKLVQSQTGSKITHIAVVINIENEPWVYEADKPRVRKIKLEDYKAEIIKKNNKKKEKDRMSVLLAEPKNEFSSEEINKLKEYFDSQMGRKYSVKSYLTEEEEKGIHCCEMTATGFNIIGKQVSNNPCAETPIELFHKFKKFHKEAKVISLD